MKGIVALGMVALLVTQPAAAQSDLHFGLAGAFRGCEEWVLNPASWSDGLEPFLDVVALGDKIGLVDEIAEQALPPEQLRAANHYWRINSTANAGYILVVSDRLPMCHITGGGAQDLQPFVADILLSVEFTSHWESLDSTERDGLISTEYRNREEPRMTLVVSRAAQSGQRTDRVQLIATAMFDFGPE